MEYYCKMYSQPTSTGEEHLMDFLDNLDLPAIGVKQNEMLISEITVDEIQKAISRAKSGKSPGTDGFGASFYKTFKEELRSSPKRLSTALTGYFCIRYWQNLDLTRTL